MENVLIKIVNNGTGLKFPYGLAPKADKQFVEENVGECFLAELININYYRLRSGVLVHVYNASEREKV